MKKAVVVGGLGFVGSAVARELIRGGCEVVVFDKASDYSLKEIIVPLAREGVEEFPLSHVRGDITDPTSLPDVFDGVDEVYHFAGVLGTDSMDADVGGAVATNIVGTLNVLETAVESARESGKLVRVFNACKPNVWLNTYSITKKCTEDFCRLYANNHPDKLAVTQLRYFNAYGPFQHIWPVRKILPTFILQAIHRLPIEVYGDGEQTTDMIHVNDMAKITVGLVRAGHTGQIFDCGTGVEMSVNQIARDVAELFGNRSEVVHLPMRHGETPGTRLAAAPSDVNAFRRKLDGFTFTDWRDGLEQTARYYQKLPRWVHEKALEYFDWFGHRRTA